MPAWPFKGSLTSFGATAPLTGLRTAWLTVARWTAPTEKGLADTLIAKGVHLEYESGIHTPIRAVGAI